MSLTNDCIRALAAGAALSCAVCAALAAAGQFPVARGKATQVDVGIDNFTFGPAEVTIHAGTRVEWVNKDDIPHTVVESTGKFRSGALDTDDRFAFTFTGAGTFTYFCSLHPHMTAKVVVTP
jgi:plastocyanin